MNQNLDVTSMRNEIATLNNLLVESADALNSLSNKLQEERMEKSKILTQLNEMKEDVHELLVENQRLRTEVQQLNIQTKIINSCELVEPLRSEDDSKPVEDFLASKLRAAQAEVTSLLKSHAEVMCDVMVEAETDLMQLLARFPGVEFEKKDTEIDPYASTKGWVGRNSRAQSAFDPDRPSGIIAHSAGTDSSTAGYFFGSPSERFPILEQSALSELEEEGSEHDDASPHSVKSLHLERSEDSHQQIPINVDLNAVHAWSSEENTLRDHDL